MKKKKSLGRNNVQLQKSKKEESKRTEVELRKVLRAIKYRNKKYNELDDSLTYTQKLRIDDNDYSM